LVVISPESVVSASAGVNAVLVSAILLHWLFTAGVLVSPINWDCQVVPALVRMLCVSPEKNSSPHSSVFRHPGTGCLAST